MEKNEYGINWLGLFIKVIILVVTILFAIWLVSKISNKTKGKSFDENNSIYKEKVIEYFSKNLPTDEKEKTVTLKELIKWDYLNDLKVDGKICDSSKSKATITTEEGYYNIKTELICGSQSKTNYIKLGNETCKDCDKKITDLKVKETNTEENKDDTKNDDLKDNNTNVTSNTTNNNSSNNSNANTNQMILYEYVKEVQEYSNWYNGKVTGNNIENKIEEVTYGKFCKNEENTYYTSGYVTSPTRFSYEVELKNINDASNIEVEASYFTTKADYKEYINQRNKNVLESGLGKYDIDIKNVSDFKNSSLTKKNFTFTVSEAYEKNEKYYVKVEINVKNLNGVTPYKTSKGSKVYFPPVKITINYNDMSNCEVTTLDKKPSGYTRVESWKEQIDMYRYIITNYEYKYSNLTSLEGYKKTGNTKVVNN